MKLIFLSIVVMLMLAGMAVAVPPGKNIDWDSSFGTVVFDGKTHADAGLRCNDCHTKIFKMKKGSDTFKMADINAGKFCGECHNGEKAFKASDPAKCVACHRK